MKFIIFLLFITLTKCDDGNPVVKQVKNKIGISDHDIPDNPWFGGEWAEFSLSTSATWFKSIDYYEEITEESNLRIDYTVQKDISSVWTTKWETIIDDSVNLCDTSKKTQSASISGLIRTLLGIGSGCPVAEDFKADTSNITFPLVNVKMYWNYDVKGLSVLRVLINMWDDDEPPNKLLKATLGIYEGDGNAYRPINKNKKRKH